jgi:hypothetical protein
MSHFSLKSLSFYGVAITTVLGLFKIVTAYGETNIKATAKIDGSYEIVENKNLPDCLQDQKLNLIIEQSGIYLFGHLSLQPKSNQSHTIAIPLSGNFKKEEIVLSGTAKLDNCNSQLQLTIQAHKEKNNLIGQIKEKFNPTEGIFTAYQKQSKPESLEE